MGEEAVVVGATGAVITEEGVEIVVGMVLGAAGEAVAEKALGMLDGIMVGTPPAPLAGFMNWPVAAACAREGGDAEGLEGTGVGLATLAIWALADPIGGIGAAAAGRCITLPRCPWLRSSVTAFTACHVGALLCPSTYPVTPPALTSSSSAMKSGAWPPNIGWTLELTTLRSEA